MNQCTFANIKHESSIVNVVSNCKSLKTFNVDFCILSSSVLAAFDKTAIQLEKYSSESQDITELRNLSLSKQRHSIYRLDLEAPIGNTDLIEILSQFTGLTTIKTYPSFDREYAVGRPFQVPFNKFLKQHKLLEFLSLSSCIIYMDHEENDEDEFKSVLNTLKMEKVTIDEKEPSATTVFDFISRPCPALKELILTARFQQYPLQRVTKLDFPNHTIAYIEVYIKGYSYIRLFQYGKPETQWYKCEKDGRIIEYISMDKGLTEYNQVGVLAVDAQHVERFVFNLPRDPFERVR